MDLFSGKEVREYTGRIHEKMKDEIAGFSDSRITTCDLEEWADYFVSKYSIQPIEVFEDSVDMAMSETKVKRYNMWSRNDPYENEYYMIDGYKIVFTVPFDGDAELLYLKPSSYILTKFPVSSLEKPTGENCGSISIEFSYIASELKGKSNVKEFVESQFEREFKDYKKMIENVNSDISQHNSFLRRNAMTCLVERKKKAEAYASLSKALDIPLQQNPMTPSATPVPLKRVMRKPVARPADRPSVPEYCISDADYKNIVNIIHNVCSSMEATARTFVKPGEEELRDFILATLGTHYINMTTGETFRKIGKTDIHIVFDNKAAFIGECKIWHGIKKFEDAVDQLFGYSTWKDTKTALIVFNKENKDFSSIQTSVAAWIKDNAKKSEKLNSNLWQCVLHRDDTNLDVQVAIGLYDLTI